MSPQKTVEPPKETPDPMEGTSGAIETMEKTMSSPKAGMFNVIGRRWKKNPKKSPKKSEKMSATGWNSSDSDYVESEEEQELDSPMKGGAEVGIDEYCEYAC